MIAEYIDLGCLAKRRPDPNEFGQIRRVLAHLWSGGKERSRTSIPKGGADSHHGRDGPNPGGLDKLIRIWPERGETAQIFSSDRFGQFRSVSEPYVYVKDLERIFNRLLLGLAAKPQYLYLKFFSVFGDLNTSDRVGVLSYSIVFCRALCF